MKLDPVFSVTDNKLFKIADNSAVDTNTLTLVEYPWSVVELEEEVYNEDFLAQSRNDLKAMEIKNEFAVIVPVVDKPLETPEQIEIFINAFNHAARRIKDATSVAGFLLPTELVKAGLSEGTPAADFIEALAKKHAQYVYFVQKENASIASQAQNSVVIL